MEGETVPEAGRAAGKATRIALGVFVSGTVVLGTALFLGKRKGRGSPERNPPQPVCWVVCCLWFGENLGLFFSPPPLFCIYPDTEMCQERDLLRER